MVRVYSYDGCSICKYRKKKCDERKPQCSPCIRNGLACSYDPERLKQLRAERVPSQQIRTLLPLSPIDNAEYEILLRVPQTIKAFGSPVSLPDANDLDILWQMMFKDELVRKSVVACYSVIQGSHEHHGPVNREALGQAVILLRKQLTSLSLHTEDVLSIKLAMTFLGLLETLGPEDSCDPLAHWKALATTTTLKPTVDAEDQAALSPALRIFILEQILFHAACIGVFSRDLEQILALWEELGLHDKLEAANPPDEMRAARSSIISGQYVVYESIMTVLAHLRDKERSPISSDELDKLDRKMISQAEALGGDFQSMLQRGKPEEEYSTLQDEYRIIIMSTRICICLLQPESPTTASSIAKLTKENLRRINDLRLLDITHAGLIWAMQITACTIQDQHDFQTLMQSFERLKPLLDPGHASRATRLMGRVRRRIVSPSSQLHNSSMPKAASLLQKKGGVLS